MKAAEPTVMSSEVHAIVHQQPCQHLVGEHPEREACRSYIPQNPGELLRLWLDILQGLHFGRVQRDQIIGFACCDCCILFLEVGVEPGLILNGNNDRPRWADVLGQPPAAIYRMKTTANLAQSVSHAPQALASCIKPRSHSSSYPAKNCYSSRPDTGHGNQSMIEGLPGCQLTHNCIESWRMPSLGGRSPATLFNLSRTGLAALPGILFQLYR